jgi:predicted CXXCH cytochrome family protein
VGSDLSDDHPISFVYDSDLAARDGFLADPGTEFVALQALDGRLLTGTIEQLLLEGGKVQCVSCHDAHDRFGHRSLLKVTDERSVLCEVCHRK